LKHKNFKFWWSQFYHFFLFCYTIHGLFKNHCLYNPRLQMFTAVFSSNWFRVLSLSFTSLAHFEFFFFSYKVWSRAQNPFFCTWIILVLRKWYLKRRTGSNTSLWPGALLSLAHSPQKQAMGIRIPFFPHKSQKPEPARKP
jgi:hypothetical protein